MHRSPSLIIAVLAALPLVAACATSCAERDRGEPAALAPDGDAPPARAALDPGTDPLAVPVTEPEPPEPEPPSFCGAQLLLTELMIDPRAASDNRGEYLELYNAGDLDVDLRGFRVDDGRHSPEVLTAAEPITVQAHGFALLAPSDDQDANGGIEPLVVLRTFSLPNSAGLIRVVDPCGEPIVRVRYDTRAPWPRSRAGIALELESAAADPSLPSSWKPARARMPGGDRGTPGSAAWWRPRTRSQPAEGPAAAAADQSP